MTWKTRLLKSVQAITIAIVKWTLVASFPIWLYGLFLAVYNFKPEAIVAMLLLCAASSIFIRQLIYSPLRTRFRR